MKKFIVSAITMALLAQAANARHIMSVKTADGDEIKYEVENVTEVYYEENVIPDDQVITVSGKEGKFTYVDLGLSVKWATYNVGATRPSEYGNYYLWGESRPNWPKAKIWKGNLFELTDEDDAATDNWGSAWRMPTNEELRELMKGCKWEWTDDFNGSGLPGRIGVSKINGNKIFFPAAGWISYSTIKNVGEEGYYMSRDLFEGNPCYLTFTRGLIGTESNGRSNCFSVRAVLK